MTGTDCDLFTHKQSRSYLNHLVHTNVTLTRVCLTTVASVCVCVCTAVFIQHAKRIRRIILSSVACFGLPYYSRLSHKRHDIGKTFLNKTHLISFFLQLTFETFLILRRIQRDIRSSRKVPAILVRF